MKIYISLLCLLVLSGCSFLSTAELDLEDDMQAVSETEMDLGEQQQIDDEMLEESELEEQEPGEPVEEEPIPYSINAFQQLDLVGTDLRFEAVEASNAAYVRHRISYLSNGVRISGVMLIPTGEGPFPLVILNHGYINPAVYTVGRGLKREQDYLARNGYAVLHTDYRNHGLSDSDPELENNYVFRDYFYGQDAVNAILAVEALDDARIDTSRIGMLGHSMGGGVTMRSLLARPDLIDAAVLYAPVHSQAYDNFYRWRADDMSEEELQSWNERLGDLTMRESFAPFSPATYVDQIAIPIQIYHGTNDESVPYDRSLQTMDYFEQAGVDAQLITFQGEKHEFIPQWNAFMQGVVEFFDNEV